ncbi:unnamed protein product [Malus baccata var. baccata]
MGLISDVFVGNALIAMYGKCGSVEDAAKVFEIMPEKNCNLFELLLKTFGSTEHVMEAKDFEVHTGAGVSGRVGDKMVLVGT